MDYDQMRRTLDEYFPRKKRSILRNNYAKGFNIIGFETQDIIEYKHCPLDPGVRLMKIKGELCCPTCGYIYRKEEAVNEQVIQPQHTKQQTRIVSAKSKKKYYDEKGNEITDEQLLKDIANGAHVISYNEVKQGQHLTIDKQTRRTIRTRK